MISRQPWRTRLLRTPENAPLLGWLRDRRSLTARIQSRGRFALRVLRQGLERPTADEARLLGLAPGVQAWVREVALRCDDDVVVFAHTVLPWRPRGPLTVWLRRLGQRSLGALLFSRAGFTRGPITFHRLDRRHTLFAPARTALQLADRAPDPLWARRSHFAFAGQSVLVSEIFSPQLLQLPGSGKENSTEGQRVL